MDKKSQKVICTAFSNGKKHDFKLFKESRFVVQDRVQLIVDSGYQGLQKIHSNTLLPKKKRKNNTNIASQRVSNEHAIGFIKRFKIVADRYRNRRKRFGLRFNLIAGICNYEN